MMIKLISYSSNSSATGIRFSQAHPLTELDRGALTQARNQKVRNHVSLFDDNYSGHFLFSVMRLPHLLFRKVPCFYAGGLFNPDQLPCCDRVARDFFEPFDAPSRPPNG